MQGINLGGVVRGGLLAGLIINISETILNVPVIGSDFEAALAGFDLPPIGGGAIAVFVVICFLVGVLSVWLYAAVRPRLGPGPQTAACVGLVVWTLFILFPVVGNVVMGLFPPRLSLIAVVWGLVEMPVATIAGAWAYRE
jgi:hypothetical protein